MFKNRRGKDANRAHPATVAAAKAADATGRRNSQNICVIIITSRAVWCKCPPPFPRIRQELSILPVFIHGNK